MKIKEKRIVLGVFALFALWIRAIKRQCGKIGSQFGDRFCVNFDRAFDIPEFTLFPGIGSNPLDFFKPDVERLSHYFSFYI